MRQLPKQAERSFYLEVSVKDTKTIKIM